VRHSLPCVFDSLPDSFHYDESQYVMNVFARLRVPCLLFVSAGAVCRLLASVRVLRPILNVPMRLNVLLTLFTRSLLVFPRPVESPFFSGRKSSRGIFQAPPRFCVFLGAAHSTIGMAFFFWPIGRLAWFISRLYPPFRPTGNVSFFGITTRFCPPLFRGPPGIWPTLWLVLYCSLHIMPCWGT